MSSFIRESIAVTKFALSSLRSRLQPSLIAVVGFAGVVLVFVGLLSIKAGFNAVMAHTGADDVAIVSNSGPERLGIDAVRIIAQAPGVAADSKGPIASGDLVASMRLAGRAGGELNDITLRGVGAQAESVWRKVHVVRGRQFRAGLNEVMVGRMLARNFPALRLGRTFHWDRRVWKIAGVFASGGDLHESEIWTNVHDMQSAYNAGNSFSGVYVRLTSAAAFKGFKAALKKNPRLTVDVERESTSFAEGAKGLDTFIGQAGGLVALLMGIGAVFGALNTLYAAVATRSREIATLRALGFGRTPVLISVLIEALALGLLGGLIGAGVAYLLFNGYQASTLGNGSIVAFSFSVPPTLLATGIIYALVMGFIGGLFPAIRAARLPVARALRE